MTMNAYSSLDVPWDEWIAGPPPTYMEGQNFESSSLQGSVTDTIDSAAGLSQHEVSYHDDGLATSTLSETYTATGLTYDPYEGTYGTVTAHVVGTATASATEVDDGTRTDNGAAYDYCLVEVGESLFAETLGPVGSPTPAEYSVTPLALSSTTYTGNETGHDTITSGGGVSVSGTLFTLGSGPPISNVMPAVPGFGQFYDIDLSPADAWPEASSGLPVPNFFAEGPPIIGTAFGVYPPDTDRMTPTGLIEQAVSLHDLPDGVWHASAPSPSGVLVALAAAGRNPTDLTLPTAGTEAVDPPPGSHLAPAATPPGGWSWPSLEALKGGFSALGNGLYNVAAGVGKTAWDLGAAPVDVVFGTKHSYASAAYDQAFANGATVTDIYKDVGLNIATLGTKPLAEAGLDWYNTGDPTRFQETSGSFLAGAVGAKAAKNVATARMQRTAPAAEPAPAGPAARAVEETAPTAKAAAPATGVGEVAPTRNVRARAAIGDAVFEDVNQTARVGANAGEPTLIADRIATKQARAGKEFPNGNMATAHAEVGAIQQAFNAGKTIGADMVLTVEGEPVCGYCVGDVAAMAEHAGLNSLTINELATGRTLYWKPGMRSLKVAN